MCNSSGNVFCLVSEASPLRAECTLFHRFDTWRSTVIVCSSLALLEKCTATVLFEVTSLVVVREVHCL